MWGEQARETLIHSIQLSHCHHIIAIGAYAHTRTHTETEEAQLETNEGRGKVEWIFAEE